MSRAGTNVLKEHLLDHVLPWWVSHGLDDAPGVLTGFDNDGGLVTSDRFTWSQGRWAWLCGELCDDAAGGRLPLDAAEWRSRCRSTVEFLVRFAVRDDGRTVFRTTKDGVAVPDAGGEVATSVFADLFVVLGIAGALRVDPEAPDGWLSVAEHILATAERSIADRTALSEPYPVPAGFRDLAGPMNLLHASAELLRARPSAVATGVRDRALATLDADFLGEDSWLEFRPERSVPAQTLLARHRTPGHLLELLWMLVLAEENAGLPTDLRRYTRLALRALDLGWDREFGGLLRYVDEEGGRPTGSLLGEQPTRYEALVAQTWDTKLWWVHADTMVATALLARLTGSPALGEWNTRIREYTLATFPSPTGEWTQVRDRHGDPLNAVVALPVKDPFHIIRALVLLARLEADVPLEGVAA
ncbi:MAG TPA: AGE family epimerase/isomerase [Propionibacteriaceae bacterium]|nr:AGE family epimerase/isomerase [Propionibacteriaceae bacterium]